MFSFPKDFLWGASLSSYQVEGGNFHADWWRWEQRPGRIRERVSAEVAADHFHRYEADFELARRLGHSAHLFSIEWSRVQPDEGVTDYEALAHDAAVVEALRARGLEPVCVLHHVTCPLWFAERYGWHHRQAAAIFERYIHAVISEIGGGCRWWIPIAETTRAVQEGYLNGTWPPGRRNPWLAYRAWRQQLLAHAKAYRVIHALVPNAMVGTALHARSLAPTNLNSSWDVRAARREQVRFNHWIPRALAQGCRPYSWKEREELRATLDFLGITYLGTEMVQFAPAKPHQLFVRTSQPEPLSNSSIARSAQGLREVLAELSQYGLPLLITGNGVASPDDSARCRYLLDHVATVAECIHAGADIRGFFYQSFLDGFEWTHGYSRQYGLIHVDRTTLVRTPNPSAYLYKEIGETGTVRPGTVSKFCPGWHNASEGRGK
ncbi:MAG: glycoside hydrolase family 1 protein [Candidatus Hydrogenedentes bacterium]|nr:glycoside hydrolase family 1 protein [Candidatus Hydrogenedentota bacterium]